MTLPPSKWEEYHFPPETIIFLTDNLTICFFLQNKKIQGSLNESITGCIEKHRNSWINKIIITAEILRASAKNHKKIINMSLLELSDLFLNKQTRMKTRRVNESVSITDNYWEKKIYQHWIIIPMYAN